MRTTTARCSPFRRAKARSSSSRRATETCASPMSHRWPTARAWPDSGGPTELGLTCVNDDPIRPGLEPIGISQRGEVSPDPHQAALERVGCSVEVADDAQGHGEQSVARLGGNLGKRLPVPALRSLDKVAIPAMTSGSTTSMPWLDRYGARNVSCGSIFSPKLRARFGCRGIPTATMASCVTYTSSPPPARRSASSAAGYRPPRRRPRRGRHPRRGRAGRHGAGAGRRGRSWARCFRPASARPRPGRRR